MPFVAFVPQLAGADHVTCTLGHAFAALGAASPVGAEQFVTVALAASSTREGDAVSADG